MTPRGKILRTAASLTEGDRDKTYGDPKVNMALAGTWKREARRVHNLFGLRNISPAEWEGIDMALTKLSRIVCGSNVHLDNYIDLVCYGAITGECAQCPMPTPTSTTEPADPTPPRT